MLPMWAVTLDGDLTPVLQALADVGTITAEEGTTAVAAAKFLRQNPISLQE